MSSSCTPDLHKYCDENANCAITLFKLHTTDTRIQLREHPMHDVTGQNNRFVTSSEASLPPGSTPRRSGE